MDVAHGGVWAGAGADCGSALDPTGEARVEKTEGGM